MPRFAAALVVLAAALGGGCASLTNPVADAIPVRRLPAEVLGRSKTELKPVPLKLLRQEEPGEYRLDRGDILAIVADDIIAPANQPAPVQIPDADTRDASVGFPIPVNDDGTISLPRLPPIPVKGLTLMEAERLVKEYATGKKGGVELVKPAAGRITVQLFKKRTYEILVVREDGPLATQSNAFGGTITTGNRKGSGYQIRLDAYENDVLRALNATGGLPGLDAKNEVVILKGKYDPSNPEKNVVRIPLRVYPEDTLTIKPEDIVLNDGDIVHIEARDADVYYTAGLIGGGQYVLPRDYDIRVIQAIAQVRGPLLNGGFSQNNFVAQSTSSGIGSPSPSLAVVIRKLPNQKQLPIRVDLNKAFVDPRENILILPGDILVLQERPGESLARYVSQSLRFTTVSQTILQPSIQQTLTSSNP